MKREVRGVGFLSAAFGDIGITLPGDRRGAGAADAFAGAALDLAADTGHGVERAIRMDQFAVAHDELGAGRRLQMQAHQPGEILAKVVHKHTGAWLG